MTSKFIIGYKKIGQIHLGNLEKQYSEKNPIDEDKYKPFKIEGIQNYNPLYKNIFELSSNNYNSISLNHKYNFLNLNDVVESNTDKIISKESFIKFSPLLDPIRYLIGKYQNNDNITELPSINKTVHPKLNSMNNASYVDNFFCYLSSQLLNTHGLINGIDYYGSFLGVQEKYKINVADDIEYLNQSDFFLKNRKLLYEIDDFEDPFTNVGSRCNKHKIDIHNSSEVSQLSIETLQEDIPSEEPVLGIVSVIQTEELLYEKNDSLNETSDDDSNNSETNYSSDEESESIDSEGEHSSDSYEEHSCDSEEENVFAYIYKFPIQMICL